MSGIALLARILWAGLALAATAAPAPARAAEARLAPTGTLRAVYLDGNPAQAVRDPRTGAITGVAADLALALAEAEGAALHLVPVRGVQGVIDAVQGGTADIGFLANDPSRAGRVTFSQTYLRNPQGVLTRDASALNAIPDIDRPGMRIGVLRGDSIALWLARNRPGLMLVMRDAEGPSETALLLAGAVDGFAGNRLRMVALAAATPGLRVLPGSIMGVPQAIIVRADNPAGLAAVDAFIDASRASGALQAWIAKAANGTEMEPARE